MVIEISIGFHNFFGCSQPGPRLLILALNVIIGKLLTNPKLYTKFDGASFNGCRDK